LKERQAASSRFFFGALSISFPARGEKRHTRADNEKHYAFDSAIGIRKFAHAAFRNKDRSGWFKKIRAIRNHAANRSQNDSKDDSDDSKHTSTFELCTWCFVLGALYFVLCALFFVLCSLFLEITFTKHQSQSTNLKVPSSKCQAQSTKLKVPSSRFDSLSLPHRFTLF
jgi:hypothetical protein